MTKTELKAAIAGNLLPAGRGIATAETFAAIMEGCDLQPADLKSGLEIAATPLSTDDEKMVSRRKTCGEIAALIPCFSFSMPDYAVWEKISKWAAEQAAAADRDEVRNKWQQVSDTFARERREMSA